MKFKNGDRVYKIESPHIIGKFRSYRIDSEHKALVQWPGHPWVSNCAVEEIELLPDPNEIIKELI